MYQKSWHLLVNFSRQAPKPKVPKIFWPSRMYQNWYLQRMDQESTDGKVLICRREWLQSASRVRNGRRWSTSQQMIQILSLSSSPSSSLLPFLFPFPSLPSPFTSLSPSPPSLAPKMDSLPENGGVFWAEFLGGGFGRKFSARKRCPKTLPGKF